MGYPANYSVEESNRIARALRGSTARDGKPAWREFGLRCTMCHFEEKVMGSYYHPPKRFCCGLEMK